MLFVNPELSMAITVTLLNSMSLIILKIYMEQYIKTMLYNNAKSWNFKWSLINIILTVSLLFVSMLYAPRGHGFFGFDYIYRCSGSYTPNPFWNATYLATRPFSIVCFFSGIRLLDSYEKGPAVKDYVCFGLSLLLTTMTKPSYSLIAMMVFIMILFYRFVLSKGKNFKKSLLFGLTFIPAGLALLYQYSGVFVGTNSMGEETGIGIEIGKAWSVYTNNIPLSIFMAAAFPIGVLLINLKQLAKTTWFRHGWQMWLAGFLTLLFLYEKGFRMVHTNFSWGYMHGLFFVFVVSVLMLLKNTLEDKGILRKGIIMIGWLGYIWHLGCGIVYFVYIYSGHNSGLF